ncbi:DUF736 domain-containing protein [Phenylobacterium kunshanense]|uniref:DUF736 domain-containing protein n=1 Tax=Phenylobacterium kunshanense TaxID=1445034 RepID=A0A328BN02_9CAUL|nr:DUF736 family protein [Phenylobacterium kunshanense]RAK66388.1 DUF736 domain-containing protein [Phenylobacterium kunshanense]
MTTIGVFQKTPDGSFHGAIRTLALSLKAVDIRPIEASGEHGPSHRVYAGSAELGATWPLTRADKPDGLSVRLDDPSFAAPINALLVETPDGHELWWSRRSKT